MPEKLNFLCFVVDQMRADHMGCAGNPIIQTPNLDALAASGVRFDRAYCNNPLCMPSRSTLFTGLTPRGHQVRTNGIPLATHYPTIVQALADSGYRTHSVGKLHMSNFQLPRGLDPASLNPLDWPECGWMWETGRLTATPTPYYGFQTVELSIGHGPWTGGDYTTWRREQAPDSDRYLEQSAWRKSRYGTEQAGPTDLPDELHYNTWVAERTIDFLNSHSADQPFFTWCSFPDPHHPYCPSEPWASMYDPADVVAPHRREGEERDLPPFFQRVLYEGIPLSGRFAPTKMSEAQTREILALTYGMVSHVDTCIGRVMAALEARGLRENTVVCFLSDHGDLMGDHWLQNKGPFHFEGLVRVPFLWSLPGRFKQAGTQALASFLDFAPTILDLAGVDIPEGRVPAEPECAQQLPAWPGRSIAPLLLGEADRVRSLALVENDEDYLGLKLRTLITDRYKLTAYPGQPWGELFDLQEDPTELHNLWNDSAYGGLRQELQLRLLEELVSTDSVLPRRMSHA